MDSDTRYIACVTYVSLQPDPGMSSSILVFGFSSHQTSYSPLCITTEDGVKTERGVFAQITELLHDGVRIQTRSVSLTFISMEKVDIFFKVFAWVYKYTHQEASSTRSKTSLRYLQWEVLLRE